MSERTDEQREADRMRKEKQRKRQKQAGLIRPDISIHPSRLDELRVIEKRLQKPKRITNKP